LNILRINKECKVFPAIRAFHTDIRARKRICWQCIMIITLFSIGFCMLMNIT